jgi:hypothetical protein
MNTATEDAKIISDASWHAWEAKGKLREAAFARKLKIIAGVATAILVLVGTLYAIVAS